MSDILADYKQWRDKQPTRIGTHSDRCHLYHERCMIHRLAAALAAEQAKEIDSLREVVRFEQETSARIEARLALTDAEREAICQAVTAYGGIDDDEECARIAATLRGLLERLR